MEKEKLRKLMEMDNEKVDKYLADFSMEILENVKKSKNNDSIFENLDLLQEFVYKVPKEAIAIVNTIIASEPLGPAVLHEFADGKLYGKTHKDLILKSVEIISRIRYIAPDDVLGLLAQLSLSTDASVKNEALGAVKKISQYDYNVLTKSKIGYSIQRKVIDFILAWTREEQLKHIDFVETAARELLNSAVEGATNSLDEDAQYKITMHFGVVSPTDYLKKIRRDTIDFVYELYKTASDSKLRLKLVQVLDEATQTPMNVVYGKDVAKMVDDDIAYLGSIYRKMIFGGEDAKMIAEPGIVSKIERRIYWNNKNEKHKTEALEDLRKDILKDDFYKLFRLLVGDPTDYREEEGWSVAEKKRDEEIDGIINLVTDDQFDDWFGKFNKIASQREAVDEWKFASFKNLLIKLAKSKPQISEKLLEKSLVNDSPLKNFIGNILDGFRFVYNFDSWDKCVAQMIDLRDMRLLKDVLYSLSFTFTLPIDEENLKKITRNKDVELLKEIAQQKNKFLFTKEIDDREFRWLLFNALARHFVYSPATIEPLIVNEIKSNLNYLDLYLNEFPTAINRGLINVGGLQPETIKLLKKKMIEFSSIEWHIQGMLLEIGKHCGLKEVLDVFKGRIDKDVYDKRNRTRIDIDNKYDAIPYHFNKDLIDFIDKQPDYAKIVSDWVFNMNTAWSVYNWDLSHFLERIGSKFDEIIISLIQKGGDENLTKAAIAINSFDGSNFDLCMEIVKKTDNEKILGRIRSNMYSTGIVSGEYGIADAYKRKAESLKKYETDKNELVKKFARSMTKDFLASEERERQRADEEKQLRKIEFEG